MEKQKNAENSGDLTLTEGQKKELLKTLLDDVLKTTPEDDATKIQQLQKAQSIYANQHKFKAGDIVRWKEFMKNKTMPEYNEPAIVLDVLTEPILDGAGDAGSTYFNQKLDLILGVITDNTFLIFYHEGSRFEPYA
jgi:hypothetical protein